MQEIQTKLDILIKLLKNKKELLLRVNTIIENQNLIMNCNSEDYAGKMEFLNEATDEKQKAIEEIIRIDTAFFSVFESFKGKLNDNRHIFKKDILKMTDIIKEITDIDVKIRVAEKRTSGLNAIPQSITQPKIKTLKANKSYIIGQYKKNTNK